MKTILIDLNIIIDFLDDRTGSEKAGELFTKCLRNEIKGYVCAHEITTLAYFLEKSGKNKNERRKIISKILFLFDVIEIGKSLLEKAVFSNITDYEDAVIVEAAKEKKMDCIIARNIKDFKNSSVPVLLPEDYLLLK